MNPGIKTITPLAIATLLGAASLIWLPPAPALSQPAAAQLVVVDVIAVGKGYRVSKLTGRPVVNDKNERIGTIDDFIIGRDRVLFTILQVGGLLGVGSRLVAVPYQSIKIDDEGNKITLPGATKEQLQKLAEFKYV
jgi:sporulation protein YlmC with PRC-barrel domain